MQRFTFEPLKPTDLNNPKPIGAAQPQPPQNEPLTPPPLPPEPVARTLTEEIEAARSAALAEGRQAGLEEGKKHGYEQGYREGTTAGRDQTLAEIQTATLETEKKLATLLKKLATQLKLGLKDMPEKYKLHEKNTVNNLAYAIARKVADQALSEHALQEIESLVEKSFQLLFDETRITVFVHESLVETLSARVDVVAKHHNFHGAITVMGDKDMKIADCNIEWKDGRIERDTEALWKDIHNLLNDHHHPVKKED